MKKSIVLLLVFSLLLPAITVSHAETTRFVTVQEWLNENGECGKCMLRLKITSILNPVLAVAEDKTGSVNLFSGNGEDSMIVNFMGDEGITEGSILVIGNPRFNIYEGTVEMADWVLLRIIPAEDPVIRTTASPEEKTMVDQALELLKKEWQEKYQMRQDKTDHGHFEIVHTQIAYVKPEISQSPLIGNHKENAFYNIYCLIDFTLLVDLLMAPYYIPAAYAGGMNVVVVYTDGTMEASNIVMNSIQRYQPLGESISAIHDLGAEYNVVLNLLDE